MDAVNNDSYSTSAEEAQRLVREQAIKDQRRREGEVSFKSRLNPAQPTERAAGTAAGPVPPARDPRELTQTRMPGGPFTLTQGGSQTGGAGGADAKKKTDAVDHPLLPRQAAQVLSHIVNPAQKAQQQLQGQNEAELKLRERAAAEEADAKEMLREVEPEARIVSHASDSSMGDGQQGGGSKPGIPGLEASAQGGMPPGIGRPIVPEPSAAGARAVALPPNVEQFVQFAAVTRNAQGTVEFRLGLTQNIMGGMSIKLSAYGQRRVGLRIRGNPGSNLNESDVHPLVDALRGKGLDVVELVVE